MSEQEIIVETPPAVPGVRVIRFNRPAKKNAFTSAMYQTMGDALDEATSDSTVGAIAFLGTEGCFSAGNDIAEFAAIANEPDGAQRSPSAFRFLQALADFEKPMIAGVDGLAIGIGATLNLHCDLTVASNRSVFVAPFVDLGLVPEAGSSLLMPRVMGYQAAFAFLALGDRIFAKEALRAGLIWKIARPEAVEAEALEAAARLAAKPVEALAITRRLLRGSRDELFSRINEEAQHFQRQLRSVEARDALAAATARIGGSGR